MTRHDCAALCHAPNQARHEVKAAASRSWDPDLAHPNLGSCRKRGELPTHAKKEKFGAKIEIFWDILSCRAIFAVDSKNDSMKLEQSETGCGVHRCELSSC